MDFDMFCEELKKQILEFVTEEVKGTIDFRMVYKNGQQNHGIVFRPEGSNVGITTYEVYVYDSYTRELKLAGEQRTKEIQNPEKQEPIKR